MWLVACAPQGANDPADAFNQPPAWPGYQWSLNGHQVGTDVIATAAGPEHCGMQSATFLTLGWPPPSSAPTAQNARQYIRDPRNILGGTNLKAGLEMHVKLPATATSTRLTYGKLTIYVDQSDQDRAIYIAGEHETERWPRSDPMTECM